MHSSKPKTSHVAESGEMTFGFDELIYSRTDERGVIISANPVFQRMAGIDWRQLVGSPHRVIRHPEMPKGFFHLFWRLLKQGEPAVGYVRNRHSSGGYATGCWRRRFPAKAAISRFGCGQTVRCSIRYATNMSRIPPAKGRKG